MKKILLALALVMGFLSAPAISKDSNFATRQSHTVSGKVTDAQTGELMIGVVVYEKGTTNGVLTDIDGNYQIRVTDKSKSILVFKFVGYITQEKQVKGRKEINVALETDSQIIEEFSSF